MNKTIALLFSLCFMPLHASTFSLEQTSSTLGLWALGIFVVAYVLVIFEEQLHLNKSKPVVIAAGKIWSLAAICALYTDQSKAVHAAIKSILLEYAELFMFLLVAMTFINVMEERKVFVQIKQVIIKMGLSYKQCFWVTGILAFFISPIADNLTTALLMGSVLLSIGKDNKQFILLSFINVVVAANAGGAFSPFGDITTLMVWQKGMVNFSEFFALFIPSCVNFLVPAAIMSFYLPNARPKVDHKITTVKPFGYVVSVLFLITVAITVCFENILHLPATIGMMSGFGLLLALSYFIHHIQVKKTNEAFNIFTSVGKAEWDTLLFFYGIILSVGGLGVFGYLNLVSNQIYLTNYPGLDLNSTQVLANSFIGIISAIIDNIPVMFSVLSMSPIMSKGQWLLVTLTAGVGGSLLSIGSAAGVALMGHSNGIYSFTAHLKWSGAIFLGYVLSIVTHLYINSALF